MYKTKLNTMAKIGRAYYPQTNSRGCFVLGHLSVFRVVYEHLSLKQRFELAYLNSINGLGELNWYKP